jgi:small GTP-binding protein
VQLNHTQRELTIKVVYYGPGLSGKSTNLQAIHQRLAGESRTHMMQVETKDDRTLFFDLFPVSFESASGYRVKVKLFTVPGQALHRATRKIVLKNADAVAFIADSQRSAAAENNVYWKHLLEDMRENGLGAEVPIVIQFNKQDLPDAKTQGELEVFQKKGQEPVIGAVAIRGQGVLETLHALLQLAYQRMDTAAGLAKSMGLSEAEFLKQVFTQLDCSGTVFAERYAKGGGRKGGGA